jgi:peptide/nickel transport system ATP-binding protein
MIGTESSPLVRITDLHLEFRTFDGVSRVLNGVNLQLMRGDLAGLVGETGSGKTLTALSIPGLIASPPAYVTGGRVEFDGLSVLDMSAAEVRRLRGRRIAMIFQDPTANLNPVFTIGEQLGDAIVNRRSDGRYPKPYPFLGRWPSARRLHKAARTTAIQLLNDVEVPDAERVLASYPHELSVGLRQRCLIALALSGDPDLLIADEPTTALDVRVQAQILALLRRLVKDKNLSVLLISHNLAVVAQICTKVAVMYAGNIVEQGPTRTVLGSPRHPYTMALLRSVPSPAAARGALKDISGSVPNMLAPPSGCRFHPRCEFVMARCKSVFPAPVSESGREVSCYLYE